MHNMQYKYNRWMWTHIRCTRYKDGRHTCLHPPPASLLKQELNTWTGRNAKQQCRFHNLDCVKAKMAAKMAWGHKAKCRTTTHVCRTRRVCHIHKCQKVEVNSQKFTNIKEQSKTWTQKIILKVSMKLCPRTRVDVARTTADTVDPYIASHQ